MGVNKMELLIKCKIKKAKKEKLSKKDREWVSEKIKTILHEKKNKNMDPKQAVAIAYSMLRNKKKK